ncbi:hypothetical protein PAMA_019957 [Pampus argenteus]
MDGIHPHFTVRTSISFLLLILLQLIHSDSAVEVEDICTPPPSVQFSENNNVDAVVVTITLQDGVTVDFTPPVKPDNPFKLEGNQLLATRVLDYESSDSHVVDLTCTKTSTGEQLKRIIVVLVTNLNDNRPVFGQSVYHVDVDEMSPVGTIVGQFPATDRDNLGLLYYKLTPDTNFTLKSVNNPDILIKTLHDYDKVKQFQMTLYVQDTPLTSAESLPSHNATTTIMVTILDVDNRPPWFEPCTKYEVDTNMICQSAGYTTWVTLNEQQTGVLPLKPGPLYAIDGDSGRNEKIIYSFLSGNEKNLFEINPNTGNITMQRATDVLGTISLTVVAAQETNSYQFATTSVTVSVLVKTIHPPQFEKPQYEGVVSSVGTMALDPKNMDKPLQIIALDEDYAATGGLNPNIIYNISSTDFSIVNGYVFMIKELPDAILSLQVVAEDMSSGELATAELLVEVTSGLTTTSLPLNTTDITVTPSTNESTTNSKTTEDIVSTTNPSTFTSSMATEALSTISTSEESISATSTAQPFTEGVIIPPGGYRPVDMVVLGVVLGVLLFICLVVIGVMAHRIQRGKTDWRKIYEASKFQSSLGQGSSGNKEGIQYTNEAFQNNEDGGSTGSSGPDGGSMMAVREPSPSVQQSFLLREYSLQHDDASSDKTDSEKEVKPILTKERRMEEGYKSVWFKEDIDPNAKEEVVIIPDSRENDSEEEDEVDNEDDNLKTPKIAFADADLDSGLGVKMDGQAEDSEDAEVL